MYRQRNINKLVVLFREIIINVDEVDLIMFNSIRIPIQKVIKINVDVSQL